MRKTYRKRPEQYVIAVQLDLDTDGFAYRKWGAEQRCKAGDWIVRNGGDTYTVDRDSFASTYREIGPGRYRKDTLVWAERAERAGTIDTRENRTAHEAGDFLVFNAEDGDDGYAIDADKFHEMYEPVDDGSC